MRGLRGFTMRQAIPKAVGWSMARGCLSILKPCISRKSTQAWAKLKQRRCCARFLKSGGEEGGSLNALLTLAQVKRSKARPRSFLTRSA